VLLRAFREVLRQIEAHLLLAGDGPLRACLADQIRRLGLGRNVRLLGPRDDIPSLLNAADVFAFPSLTEGLPNALLEAMAAGCPIVTTNVPGCRDLIDHEQTGLVVPYGDVSGLATSILRLMGDRECARRLGGNAAAIVPHMWHFQRTLDGYTAVYDEIVAELDRGVRLPE